MGLSKKAVGDRAPKSCRECQRWKKVKDRAKLLTVLETAITKMETQLKAKALKPTIAEYLKLVQMEKELEETDEPKEIRVTWVEATPESKSEE